MFDFQYHIVKLMFDLTKLIKLALQRETNHIKARLPSASTILTP